MDKKLNYTITGTAEFPIEPIGARLILEPLEEKEEESKIIILEDTAKKEKQQWLAKGKVVAIGPIEIPIKVGDIVRIWGNQFEAPLVINKKQYLIYAERNIICKIK